MGTSFLPEEARTFVITVVWTHHRSLEENKILFFKILALSVPLWGTHLTLFHFSSLGTWHMLDHVTKNLKLSLVKQGQLA